MGRHKKKLDVLKHPVHGDIEVVYGTIDNLTVILQALKENFGNIMVAAKQIGMSAETVYNYRNHYDCVKDEIVKGRLNAGDAISAKLIDKAMAGDNQCMMFYLSRRAGWVESSNVVVEQTTKSVNIEAKDKEEADDILNSWAASKREPKKTEE